MGAADCYVFPIDWPRRTGLRASMLLLGLAWLTVLGGCCCEEDDLDVYWTDWGDDEPIRWSERVVLPRVAVARIVFSRTGVVLREIEMLEFYRGVTRLDAIAGSAATEDLLFSCPTDVVQYDLSSLTDGEYTVVHRARSAPEGFVFDWREGADWTRFEGESALVTMLVVRASPIDAGSADAAGAPDAEP